MWPFLQTILNSAMPLKDKATYLGLVINYHDLRIESDSEIAFIKDKIQELISSPLTRLEGYFFLDALLRSHPTIYIHNWGPIIIGSLKCPDNYVSKELTLKILTLVVANFSGKPSCAEAFQRFIPEIILMLLKVDQNDLGFVYCCKALAVCMQSMPAIVGPHCDEIEKFLIKNMDCLNPSIIAAVSECFAVLPVCHGYYKKQKPCFVDTWSNLYTRTFNTLQALLNDILRFPEGNNFVDVENDLIFDVPFEPNDEEFSYVLQRTRVFSSLCTCLAKMMSVRFEGNSSSTRVQIPVPELFKCLGRILHIEDILKWKQMPKCSAFLLAYPLIQNAVLVVLGAVIVNFTALEQVGNFARLLQDLINATKLTTFTQASSSKIRSTIWGTLNVWLKQYGAKGSYEIINDRFLVQELLKDVALASENEPPQERDPSREECCLQALQVVENMFTAGGSYMDKRLVDVISFTYFKVVRKVQHHLHPSKKFPSPYNNEKCRYRLYDSLILGAMFGDSLQIKYINQAINIFKIAMRDPNLEINSACHKAFKLCRFYLNPRKLLPEALACLVERKELSLPQINVQAGWECGNWNANSGGPSLEENSMEVAPPCQIESVFHTSVNSDDQTDMPPVENAASPIHLPEAHGSQNQCNGSNSRVASSKPSRHSSICNDSESEVGEYKAYNLGDTQDAVLPVDVPPIAQTCTITSLDDDDDDDTPVGEPKATTAEPKVVELKTLEPVIPEKIAAANHEELVQDVPMNNVEIEEAQEEVPREAARRMAENGMDVESGGDDDDDDGVEEEGEDVSDDDDDDVNETYHHEDDGYSPESYDPEAGASEKRSPEYYERPVKRRKLSNEEDHSSEEIPSNLNQEMMQDDESEEDDAGEMPNRSPTITEMCQDFVLAEPEEIS